MGNNESNFKYAVPIGQAREGETPVYRHIEHQKELISFPEPGIKTMQELVEYGYKHHKDKPLVGKQHPKTKKYIYRTYGQEYLDARKVGSAIQNFKLYYDAKEYKDFNLKFIGIFMQNCLEWNTIDMACSLYGFVLVPFYDNLVGEQVTYILKQTGMTTVFCTEKQSQQLLDTQDIYHLKNIIVVGKLSTDDRQRARTRGLKIFEYRNLLEDGQKNPRDLPKDIKPTDVFTFSYTSGSTGLPKGVMLKHVSFLSPIASMKELQMKQSDRMLCYMPLPHGTSRFCNMLAWYIGSKIGFSSGDITKLNEDLQRLKPTLFITVPTLFNKYYEVINDQFSKITGCKGALIKKAISTKLENLKTKNSYTHPIYDPLIFNKIKNLFGGQVRHCISASAPISKEVLDFFKISLGICVLEAFGLTEAGGMQFCTRKEDINASGKVGGARANIEVKLIDIPEMGFLSSDASEEGYPLPRGEICTRGPGLFAGYYKDEAKTVEILDKEGWLHSGDIGVIYPNGCLRVIGRKANVFKLNNGKFVSPERIENSLVRVKGVSEVFITSNSTEECVVAVVVPQKEFVIKILQEQPNKKISHAKQQTKVSLNVISPTATAVQLDEESIFSFEDACKGNVVSEYFLKQFEQQAKQDEIHPLDCPKKVIIESQSFFQLGLYTQSFKLQRFFARKHFISELEKI